MTERETKPSPDHDRVDESRQNDEAIIPGRHGKHGGGMESEGAPQKDTRDAGQPSKSTDAARRDDGA